MKYKGPWELYDIEADRTEQHNLIREAGAGRQDDRRVGRMGQARRRRPLAGPKRNDWGSEIGPPGEKKQGAKKNARKAAQQRADAAKS